jgi:diguanylate cyclase (GGDEF)-like protein
VTGASFFVTVRAMPEPDLNPEYELPPGTVAQLAGETVEKRAEAEHVFGELEAKIRKNLEEAEALRVQAERFKTKADELERKAEELEVIAFTDHTTGIMNRLALDRKLDKFIEGQMPLTAVFLDVDHFKRTNDAHGHAAGDEVLKHFARHLEGIFTDPGTIVARQGGEEFVVIIPNLSKQRIAETKFIVEEGEGKSVLRLPNIQPFKLPDGSTIQVTASVGITEWQLGESRTDLLHRADEIMFAAKAAGRNQAMTDLPPNHRKQPVAVPSPENTG